MSICVRTDVVSIYWWDVSYWVMATR